MISSYSSTVQIKPIGHPFSEYHFTSFQNFCRGFSKRPVISQHLGYGFCKAHVFLFLDLLSCNTDLQSYLCVDNGESSHQPAPLPSPTYHYAWGRHICEGTMNRWRRTSSIKYDQNIFYSFSNWASIYRNNVSETSKKRTRQNLYETFFVNPLPLQSQCNTHSSACFPFYNCAW